MTSLGIWFIFHRTDSFHQQRSAWELPFSSLSPASSQHNISLPSVELNQDEPFIYKIRGTGLKYDGVLLFAQARILMVIEKFDIWKQRIVW